MRISNQYLGIGDFVPGSFALPQQPAGLGCADGCTSCSSCKEKHGMGTLSDTLTSITDSISAMDPTTIVLYGVVGVLVLNMLLSGPSRRRKRS